MVRASGLRGYGTLMRQLGVDPLPLLRRYRIPAPALADEDALLSLRAVVHLLEASAEVTDCPDFGLRLSHLQDISVLGPLAIVMQNAPTVRSAIEDASRYLFVHSPGLVLSLQSRSALFEEAVEVRMEVRLERLPAQRQTLDLCLADVLHMIELLAGPRHRLLGVALPHAPLAPAAVYRQFFRAPVSFEQAHGGLHIARTTLDAGLQDVNHTLRRIAVDYLAQQFGAPFEHLSGRVRQALRRTLGTPQGNKTDIADLLGLHPRTLQRHLVDEGTSFDAIREEVRQEVALRYLRETRVPVGQLAGLLGFTEQSALARACRRWFGAPPTALRRELTRRSKERDLQQR